MNRKSKVVWVRNEAIRTRFGQHLQEGAPTMIAYAKLSYDFELSEVQIRRIIAEKSAPC